MKLHSASSRHFRHFRDDRMCLSVESQKLPSCVPTVDKAHNSSDCRCDYWALRSHRVSHLLASESKRERLCFRLKRATPRASTLDRARQKPHARAICLSEIRSIAMCRTSTGQFEYAQLGSFFCCASPWLTGRQHIPTEAPSLKKSWFLLPGVVRGGALEGIQAAANLHHRQMWRDQTFSSCSQTFQQSLDSLQLVSICLHSKRGQ